MGIMAYTKNPYLPKMRMQTVMLVRSGWSIRKAARHVGVNPSTVSRWVRKAPADGRFTIPTKSSRPHHHPNHLRPEIELAIINQRKKHNRCAEVIHEELSISGIEVSLSTVKRTLKRNGMLRVRSPWKRWHFPEPRPRAEKAGDLVQIDTIHFMLSEKKRFYVYTLLDVASRWTHAKTVTRISASRSLVFLKEARAKADFDFRIIQSDHGPEFSTWFSNHARVLGISHRHSRVRQANDNGHIERFNRTIQEECLRGIKRRPYHYQKAIKSYLPYYNNERLHLGLNLKTPRQVLQRS